MKVFELIKIMREPIILTFWALGLFYCSLIIVNSLFDVKFTFKRKHKLKLPDKAIKISSNNQFTNTYK